MAHGIHKLTPTQVQRARGRWLNDGGGLYLNLQHGASWVFRYKLNKRPRMMGLGPVHTVSLDEARDLALAARKQLRAGQDPLANRPARTPTRAAANAPEIMTFAKAADLFITDRAAVWTNPKHVEQWRTTLAEASQVLGPLSVATIATDHVLQVLTPIWQVKQTTANRLRNRIENVLDWAKAKGHRAGDNPARWGGHLEHILAAKTHKVVHHAELSYGDLPTFLLDLRTKDGIGARALEFAILTATRTGDVRSATHAHIDRAARIWTIPLTKNGEPLRVPLSDAAMQLLSTEEAEGPLFPGRNGKAFSPNALLATLHRMGRDDITVHGFRATFKTWSTDRTSYPRELAEAALAHKVGNDVERAYQRSDMVEKRRALMNDWAAYCTTVISLHAVAA